MGKKIIATIGSFDGVHLGHRALFDQMRAYASQYADPRLVVLTFTPYPADVLRPSMTEHIDPPAMHLERLSAQEGLEVFPLQFSRELASHSAETFMREVLRDQLGVTDLILGYDNRFGMGANLTLADYQRLGESIGIRVVQAESLLMDGEPCSSTRVKGYIRTGQMREAERLLGRPYTIYGSVVSGQQLGRTLGYPTANVQRSDAAQLLPPDGVYAADLAILRPSGQWEAHHAMLYIGKRPTLGGELERTIEVHILDFDEDIYGMTVAVHIYEQLQTEKKFHSTDELRQALQHYEELVRRYFREHVRY